MRVELRLMLAEKKLGLAMVVAVHLPLVVGRMPSVMAAWRPTAEAELPLAEAVAWHLLAEEQRPWVVVAWPQVEVELLLAESVP